MRTSPNRLLGTIFGAVYLLVGLLGFAVTGGIGFLATKGGLLLGIFEVNPLHNIAHLLIGAALLIADLFSVAAAKGVVNADRRGTRVLDTHLPYASWSAHPPIFPRRRRIPNPVRASG